MNKEKELFSLIDEKKSIIRKTKEEIENLEYQIHLIYKEKLLSKFKMGDVLVTPKINTNCMFTLDLLDSAGIYGYARTSKILWENGETTNFTVYPQPIVLIDKLVKYGRKANREEVKRFKEAFKNGKKI